MQHDLVNSIWLTHQGNAVSEEHRIPHMTDASDSEWGMKIPLLPKPFTPRPVGGFPALRRLTQTMHPQGHCGRDPCEHRG